VFFPQGVWLFESFKAHRKLKDLDERLSTVEREMKALKMEWEDTYDRLRRVVQRVAKRAEIVERAERAQGEQETEGAEENTGLATPVVPGLDPISQKILARRHRLANRERPQ